eukprot:6194530-Pleurochrysis_carterae.AAC.3
MSKVPQSAPTFLHALHPVLGCAIFCLWTRSARLKPLVLASTLASSCTQFCKKERFSKGQQRSLAARCEILQLTASLNKARTRWLPRRRRSADEQEPPRTSAGVAARAALLPHADRTICQRLAPPGFAGSSFA